MCGKVETNERNENAEKIRDFYQNTHAPLLERFSAYLENSYNIKGKIEDTKLILDDAQVQALLAEKDTISTSSSNPN